MPQRYNERPAGGFVRPVTALVRMEEHATGCGGTVHLLPDGPEVRFSSPEQLVLILEELCQADGRLPRDEMFQRFVAGGQPLPPRAAEAELEEGERPRLPVRFTVEVLYRQNAGLQGRITVPRPLPGFQNSVCFRSELELTSLIREYWSVG